MPKVSNSKANNFFQIALKPILEWHEAENEDDETSSIQSFDSDASEDFFDNFCPEIEKQIIESRAKLLDQLATEIAKSHPIILEAFDRKETLDKQRNTKAPPKKKRKKILSRIFGNSLANETVKNRFANGRTMQTNRKQTTTPTVTTRESQPVRETTC